jgi:hypothetical protein
VHLVLNLQRAGRTSGAEIDLENLQGVVLALSTRVGDIVASKGFEGLPITWITVPWAPLRRLPKDAITVDVFSLLSKKDLWLAFCDAVRVTYILFRRKRTSQWALQSYTAFRWFAVRTAVDKLPGRLVMMEHYDRWAVLVDSSLQAYKRVYLPSGQAHDRELTLIQHGVLSDLCSSVAETPGRLRLTRKLGAVSKIYVYSPTEEETFKREVLTEGCVRRGLEVTYFTPRIELSENFESSRLKLLFVGHPLCELLHRHIFQSLRVQLDFKGYYKPHPIASMSVSMQQVGWVIIDDPSLFPVVDLLISYPSTLVVEYKEQGIPALVHPMDLRSEDSESYIKSVREQIKLIKLKRIVH